MKGINHTMATYEWVGQSIQQMKELLDEYHHFLSAALLSQGEKEEAVRRSCLERASRYGSALQMAMGDLVRDVEETLFPSPHLDTHTHEQKGDPT